MPSLRETQQELAASLLSMRSDVSWGTSAYRRNAFGNWTGALANAYPIVRKIVGEDFFDGLARAYAREHPSTSGDLNECGVRLPGFVAAFPHTQDLPYLPDVARMEWLARLALYAPDAPVFDPAALAKVPPENYPALRPKLAPGATVFRSDWPVARVWEVHQEGYRGDFAVNFVPGIHRVLVYRPRWRAEVRPISLGEYRFLAGAGRGESLGEFVDAALHFEPAFDAAVVLQRWIAAGALSL